MIHEPGFEDCCIRKPGWVSHYLESSILAPKALAVLIAFRSTIGGKGGEDILVYHRQVQEGVI